MTLLNIWLGECVAQGEQFGYHLRRLHEFLKVDPLLHVFASVGEAIPLPCPFLDCRLDNWLQGLNNHC